MAKTNSCENDLLGLFFRNVLPSWDGSATMGSPTLEVRLHTADPGVSGTPTTSQIGTTYTPKSINRSTSKWSVSGGQATSIDTESFATMSGSTATATHASMVVDEGSGVLNIAYRLELQTAVVVGAGAAPEFPFGNITVTED